MSERFRLRWDQSISRELLEATSIANPSQRRKILSSIGDVEAILASEADTAGESREPGVRFLIQDPISVHYKVNLQLHEVLIFRVRVFRTRE